MSDLISLAHIAPLGKLLPWAASASEEEQSPPGTRPASGAGAEADEQGPGPRIPLWGIGLLVVGGILVGAVMQSLVRPSVSQANNREGTAVATVEAQRTTFQRSVRIGGTVGASNFAMIRAPRMEGGRDRGGGSGLTIQTLAEPGSIVAPGEVVAEFESKRTQDVLDNYSSTLAQTRSLVGTRKAEMLIATETLRQTYRTTKAETDKSELDLLTAEVRSAIQAEIFNLMAQEGRASTEQLAHEVRLQEAADAAETRSLEITVEQDSRRMERTQADLEKMKVRTPVGGLVVIETMFNRGTFQQASPGDQVYAGSYFMRVVDLSSMAVYAQLNQADSQLVQLGLPVQVRLDAYPDVTFPGRVRAVGAMAVSGGGGGGGGRRGPPGSRGGRGEWIKQVPVEVEILESDDRVKPDLSASADIVVEELDDALVIPRAAIGEAADGAPQVWVRDGDDFAPRRLELGPVSDIEAVVLSGLSEGDVIAVQAVAQESELALR